MQDEGLNDPTFLVYLRRQQDLQMRQLSAPTLIPACTSGVSSSPVVITRQSATDYNSSMRACSAIFAPDPPRVASIPTSREFRAAQENDSALQKWIVHHKTSTSRFRPELIKCEGGTAVWSDVAVTPARVLVPVEFQRGVFDSLHQLTHPADLGWIHLQRFRIQSDSGRLFDSESDSSQLGYDSESNSDSSNISISDSESESDSNFQLLIWYYC